MYRFQLVLADPYFPSFEGEENKEGENKEAVTEEKTLDDILKDPGLSKEVRTVLEGKVIPILNEKRLTKAQVDKIINDEKNKHKTQIDETVTQLESLKKSKQLTEQEKQQLQHRIEELQATVMTAEERAVKDKEKLQKEHQRMVEDMKKDSEMWRGLYAQESINNRITKASVDAKAVSPEQIGDLLVPRTRLSEILDEQGQPSGRYIPKVKFRDTDKEGKEVELDLTIEEAIKRMRDLPDRFGNLFQSDTNSGIGGTGGRGSTSTSDPSNPPKDFKNYEKWRQQQNLNRKKGAM